MSLNHWRQVRSPSLYIKDTQKVWSIEIYGHARETRKEQIIAAIRRTKHQIIIPVFQKWENRQTIFLSLS